MDFRSKVYEMSVGCSKSKKKVKFIDDVVVGNGTSSIMVKDKNGNFVQKGIER